MPIRCYHKDARSAISGSYRPFPFSGTESARLPVMFWMCIRAQLKDRFTDTMDRCGIRFAIPSDGVDDVLLPDGSGMEPIRRDAVQMTAVRSQFREMLLQRRCRLHSRNTSGYSFYTNRLENAK